MPANIFLFLEAKKQYSDGYLGLFQKVNIYPSFGHGIQENNILNQKNHELFLKNLTEE